MSGQIQNGTGLLVALQQQQQAGNITLLLRSRQPVWLKLGSLKVREMKLSLRCQLGVAALSPNISVSFSSSGCSFRFRLYNSKTHYKISPPDLVFVYDLDALEFGVCYCGRDFCFWFDVIVFQERSFALATVGAVHTDFGGSGVGSFLQSGHGNKEDQKLSFHHVDCVNSGGCRFHGKESVGLRGSAGVRQGVECCELCGYDPVAAVVLFVLLCWRLGDSNRAALYYKFLV
ncbi:hypothetical protein GQ457_03G029180 [Hibiscus cannabinus]